MQTFAEYIAESFNSNAKLMWDYPRRSHATATFGVDGIKVIVSFEQREPDGPWHVVFEVDLSDGTAAVHSSFEIFNGVFQAIDEFIEVREPETLVFAHERGQTGWHLSNVPTQVIIQADSVGLQGRGSAKG